MNLEVIEREGKRVLTTAQIAQAFDADTKSVTRNFQRNIAHFEQGKHYFALTGETLKQFKGERQNDATLKFASNLYLWTEEGAFMLAKSLNSKQAWQAYNLLVSQYYAITRELQTAPNQAALPYDEKRFIALESRVQEIEQRLKDVTLHSGEQRRLQRAIGERVYQLSKQSGDRPVLFRALYTAIKERYHVGSYRDVKQHELQDALKFVYAWEGGVPV
ncbi:ORF6N domain-containing protein [Solibacillus sp. FSL H8-0538]|uniref:ORF6N domain-containing protein n=1 Tax=Solibacillus sp. FSL H8-0538 TaxID=2921400 RepID=UPI0030F82B0E